MKRKLTFIIFASCMLPFAMYCMYIVLTSPYFQVNTLENGDGQIVVTYVSTQGAAAHIGLQPEDIIVKVNGERANENTIYRKHHKLEQVHSIEFIRDGELFTRSIHYQYSIREVIYFLVIPCTIFIFCIVLSYLMIRQKTNDHTIWLLVLLLVLIGLGSISAGASSRGDTLARIVTMNSFILSPLLLFHLFFKLFQDISLTRFWKRVLFFLYCAYGSLLLIELMNEITYVHLPLYETILILYFVLIVGLLFYVGLKTYIIQKKQLYATTIKVYLTGLFLAFFPFVGLSIMPALFMKSPLLDPEVASLFIIFLPLTIFYLIHKERIVDIDYIFTWVKKDLLLAILAGLVFYAFTTIENTEKAIINSFYVIVICLALLLLRNPIYFKVPSFFHSQSLQLDERLNRFFKRVEKETSPKELVKIIEQEVHRVIPTIQFVKHFEIEQHSGKLITTSKQLEFLQSHKHSLLKPTIQIGEFTSVGKGFCVLIYKSTDHLLFLYCSNKNNRTELNPVERAWIETLANYSNVLLTNQYSIEQVISELKKLKENDQYYSQWLANFLFNFTERERVRLAGDLHDTILQDLLFINMNLQRALKDAHPSTVQNELVEISELILDCVHTTREACNRLAPPFLLQHGLVQTIEELINKAHLQANFQVNFEVHAFHDELLTDDCIVALYRIIQELLSNAMKHSNATIVSFSLNQTNEHITLHYSDDGIGMDVDKLVKDYANFNGLINMQERVKSLHGDIHFYSENGLQVTIELPFRSNCIRLP